MITETDAMNTIEFDDYFATTPNSEYLSWDREKFIDESNGSKGKYCEEGFSYKSCTNGQFLSVDELRKLIENHISE